MYSYIVLVCKLQVPGLPTVLESLRYYISYNAVGSGSTRAVTLRAGRSGGSDMRLSYTLTSLTRDTEYIIQIRAEIGYSPCTTFVSGNYSNSVSFRTNATSESQKHIKVGQRTE